LIFLDEKITKRVIQQKFWHPQIIGRRSATRCRFPWVALWSHMNQVHSLFWIPYLKKAFILAIKVGMATGRDGDEFRYLILIPSKKFIPIPKPNGYQTFVSSPSPPSNEYMLVPIPIPIFLLLNIN